MDSQNLPPSHPPRLNPPMAVLVIEDEPRLRELLVDVIPDMGRSGFSTTGVRSGEEGLKLMAIEPRDIVILDLNLPGIDGMDVFKTIRERWPLTQVIILTGFGDLDAARQAIRLQVVDFLTKPCHLSDVEVALDRARRRRVDLQRADIATSAPPAAGPVDPPAFVGPVPPAPTTLEDSERQMIFAALERHDGNRTAAAAALGISRRTLHYRLLEYEKQGFPIP